MPKLIVSLPDDIEDRVRTFARKRGDLSKVVTEALNRCFSEYDKQRVRVLKSTQRSVREYVKERRFSSLVKAEGRFTLNGADIRLIIDDSVRDSKLNELLGIEEKVDRKGGWLDAPEQKKTIQDVRFVHAEDNSMLLSRKRSIPSATGPWRN